MKNIAQAIKLDRLRRLWDWLVDYDDRVSEEDCWWHANAP
jgi:hypothetical protein